MLKFKRKFRRLKVNITLLVFRTLLLPPSSGNFKKMTRLKFLNIGIILPAYRVSNHRRLKSIAYEFFNSFDRPWINSRKNKRKTWEMVERIFFMLQKAEESKLIILKEKKRIQKTLLWFLNLVESVNMTYKFTNQSSQWCHSLQIRLLFSCDWKSCIISCRIWWITNSSPTLVKHNLLLPKGSTVQFEVQVGDRAHLIWRM